MVREIQTNETSLFQCEECGLKYRDKETAEKCQAWCAEHQSCNIEIIKSAVTEQPAHYICTGGCGGVADVPGTCQAPDCLKHQHPLQECHCADGRHGQSDREESNKIPAS